MGIYDTFYVIYYNFLKRFHTSSPEYTAMLLVGATQLLHVAIILAVIQRARGVLLFASLPSKYYALIVTIPWLIFLIMYFSKARKERIILNYNQKTDKVKSFWQLTALLAIVLPFIGLPILLSR